MKRVIRGSATSSNNKPKNAVWVKDGQDMKWKIFKGTDNDTVDSNFLSRVNKQNHANYIDVIVVPNGKHPNEFINSSSQSSKNAAFKTDKRLSPTSERYKGYLIVLDRGGDGYNVYDRHRELEDAGYPSREAAKKFIDELVDNGEVYSSTSVIDVTDLIRKAINGDSRAIKLLKGQGYKVNKLINPLHRNEVGTYEVTDTDGRIYNYDNTIIRNIHSSTSDDEYNEYSFMVGDQLEWSGLYGGQYKGVVTDVNDEYITVDVMWTSEDTGDTVIDTQKFEIVGDPEGKECIIVYQYGSDAGYVYPPSCDNVNSAEAIDDSEREFQRIDRSGTDEEVQLAAVMYNLGATLAEAREILPALSEDKIKDYVDYYNLRHLPTSERVKIWSNRKHSVTSSETFDAQSYAKQRKQSSEFNKWLKRVESAISRNDTTRIKNIKESLMYMTSNQLSNKLASYLIDKLNSALTTPSDDIKSASYGGAFDIEDDQYFTKDEIAEFGNTVCDHLNETFYDTYYVSDVCMETPKKLVLTVVQKSDESEFTATIDIDMRKIKKPADLMNRYLGDVVYALQQDIKSYNDEINASSDTTSRLSNDVIANSITNQLPPTVNTFLMDIAQIYGEFSYSDIIKHRFSNSEIKQLQNLRRRYFKYAEFDDEDKIQSIIYNVNKIVLGNSLNASITAARKSNVDLLKTKIWNAASAKMEDMGFPVDEIPDYLFVEVKQADDHIRVEVRAELTYNGLTKLTNELDPIVQSFDKDSYFEPVEPGIAEAYIWNLSKINSSETVEAGIYDVPDRPLDPPEDDSWTELDTDDEVIEVTLDAIVHIDEDGSWEYDDTNYPWAASPDNNRGDWYTDEYSVYIGDKTSIVEYVDELLEPMMPAKAGEYHIKGDATLVFAVEGIQVKRDYFWDERHGADYDEESYTDDAETSFLYDKSHINNFEITER